MYYLLQSFNGYSFALVGESDSLDFLVHKRKELRKLHHENKYVILRDIYWRLD